MTEAILLAGLGIITYQLPPEPTTSHAPGKAIFERLTRCLSDATNPHQVSAPVRPKYTPQSAPRNQAASIDVH